MRSITQWTLVGGLMVQLHAAYAGVQVTRTTRDIANLSPKRHPKVLGHRVFAVSGGTSALRRTVNCEVDTAVGAVALSIHLVNFLCVE